MTALGGRCQLTNLGARPSGATQTTLFLIQFHIDFFANYFFFASFRCTRSSA